MDKKIVSLIVEKIYWERKKSKLFSNLLIINWHIKLWIIIFLLPSVLWLSDKETDFHLRVFAWVAFLFFVLMLLVGLLRTLNDYYYKLPRYQRKIDEINRQIVEELKKTKT